MSKVHLYFANYILDVCFMCENVCENASKQKLFMVQSSHKQLEIILKGIYCVKQHLHPVIDHKLEKYSLNIKYLPIRSSSVLVKAESMTQEVPLNLHLVV